MAEMLEPLIFLTRVGFHRHYNSSRLKSYMYDNNYHSYWINSRISDKYRIYLLEFKGGLKGVTAPKSGVTRLEVDCVSRMNFFKTKDPKKFLLVPDYLIKVEEVRKIVDNYNYRLGEKLA